jgi:hypothetical protein
MKAGNLMGCPLFFGTLITRRAVLFSTFHLPFVKKVTTLPATNKADG